MAARVSADQAYGARLGVVSTPTFVVADVQADGTLRLLAKIEGVRPYSTFASMLEEALSAVASTEE